MWNELKARVIRFMQGRYGMDPLYRALFYVYALFLVLTLIFRQQIFFMLGTPFAVLAIYRAFSRQHAKRAAENQRYLGLKKKLLLQYNRFKFRKTHRYQPCPSCKTVLKLEKKPGVMTVNCPRCHHTFQITMR